MEQPALMAGTVVATVAGVAAVGRWWPGSRVAARTTTLLQRFDAVVGRVRARVGVVAAVLGLLVVGMAVILAVLWPVGEALASLEDGVDIPVIEWFLRTRSDGALWRASEIVTAAGDPVQIQIVVVIATVVLAAAFRRQWWVPVLLVAGGYLAEKYGQKFLAEMVDRGKPSQYPGDQPGTFPSGGMARLIVVWGMVGVLTFARWPGLARFKSVAVTLYALAIALEAYTRNAVLKHWITDVVGGLLFGLAMVALLRLALRVVEGQAPSAGAEGATGDHRVERPAVPAGGAGRQPVAITETPPPSG